MKIAIFDFDGTITDRDTILPFFLFWVRLNFNYKGILFIILYGLLVKFHLLGHQNFKRKIYYVLFRGVHRDDLKKAVNSFYRQFITKHLRPDILETIKKYKAEGFRNIVLSANFKFVIEPFCQEFGLECWAIDGIEESQRMTGRLEGEFLYGKEKLRFAENRLTKEELENAIAFGDAPSDIYLLNRVKKGIWVGQKN